MDHSPSLSCTINLFIGPKTPEGKETSWLATAPGRGFFAILCLYGPEQPAIDYSWKPGDIERVRQVHLDCLAAQLPLWVDLA